MPDSPLRRAAAPDAPVTARVLVVDDRYAQSYAVARALRAEGFTVTEADSGQAALAAAALVDFDAIVLDVEFPDMDGFAVCRALKGATDARLPVLHLSSTSTSSEARARGLDAGADGYLTHPFDPNELRAAVSALVRLKRQESARDAQAAVNSVLSETLDALADHVALLDRHGVVVAVNSAWVDFAAANQYAEGGTGLGANYCDLSDAATGAGSDEAHAAAGGIRSLLAGDATTFELDYPCHAPTEERWFRLAVRRVANAGRVAAVVTHTNRTRECLAARAEAAALAAAEADRRRLQATLDALPVGVWLSDSAGQLTHSNPAVARIWGGDAPPATTPGNRDLYRGVWPDTGVQLAPTDWALARTLRSGETIDGEIVEIARFDGARGYVINSAAPIIDELGRAIGAVAVNVDVTEQQALARERERLVASLELERARLAAIFEEAPAFLAAVRGADHVFERVNPAYLQLVGHRDIIGKSVAEAMPEIRAQGFIEILDGVRATGTPFIGKQIPVQLMRVADAPLETRYIDLVYQRLEDPGGDHTLVAHGVDVTDQVLATEALRRVEQRLREQFAKLPVPTYLWETRGQQFVLQDWNDAAKDATLWPGDCAIGRAHEERFPDSEGICDDLRRCLDQNVVVRRTVERRSGTAGAMRTFDLTLGPQQPDRVLVHAVDVTERTALEAQLRQAQKMEAVGRLAGGVAHDFNNLLTVIGAHSSFLLESLDSGDVRHEDAEAIQSAAVRAAGLTRQLLAFSRKQILRPAPLSLNTVIDETRKMLARLLGEDIEIVARLAPDLGRVIADATQLDQILMNLAVNARDAMPKGGRLTISTRSQRVSDALPGAGRVVPPGDYALLEVQDTGVGMDDAVQAQLFEPFFTTKPPGQGTGLGLATVYGIVKQSAGYILVESAPGRGTTFRIYLPTVSSSEGDTDLRVAESAAIRGVETILLVEDEPAVREIARRVLKRQGYVVLEAGNGAEALAISAAFTSVIHLVISDAVMPGMGGAEVVQRLQAQRPGLRAMFMSGYTDDEIVRRGIVTSAVPFVQKPFELADFERSVRDALDG